MPIPFRADLRPFLDEFAEQHSGVRPGRMFGLPAVYVGRRLVACLIEDGIIVRLPIDVARREIKKQGEPFSRKGRPPGPSARSAPSRYSSWVLYRPRTILAARRLSPILEIAARHVAIRQAEDLTGVTILRRR